MTYLGVVMLDVDIGLLIGLVISIFTVVVHDQLVRVENQVESSDPSLGYISTDFIRPESSEVKPVPNCSLLKKRLLLTDFIRCFKLARQKIRVFKVHSSIYFVNCEAFLHALYKLYGMSPYDQKKNEESRKLRSPQTVSPTVGQAEIQIAVSDAIDNAERCINDNCFVLDLSSVNYMDTNGVNMLLQLITDYKKVGVTVYLCSPQGKWTLASFIFIETTPLIAFLLQDHFIKMAYKMGLLDKFDSHIYLSIRDVLNDLDKQLIDLVDD